MLLCRSDDMMETKMDEVQYIEATHASRLPYRRVAKNDRRLLDVIRKHSELLRACPEDYLLHPW